MPAWLELLIREAYMQFLKVFVDIVSLLAAHLGEPDQGSVARRGSRKSRALCVFWHATAQFEK